MDLATAGTAPPPLTVELRLQPSTSTNGTRHVAGTVAAAGGPSRGFDGWLDLLQVLEALVEGEG